MAEALLLMLTILLAFAVHGPVLGQVQIRCYSCVTPWSGADFASHCDDSTYCTGIWCTKGPDDESNGILHSCASNVPLDSYPLNSGCKAVNSSRGFYDNCYCKNIEYCNGATGRDHFLPTRAMAVIALLACAVRLLL